MQYRRLAPLVFSIAVAGLSSEFAFASAPASDAAANYPAGTGDLNGLNDGTGFGPFVETVIPGGGSYVSATDNATNINPAATPTFDIYSYPVGGVSGSTTELRPLTGGPLLPTQTISFDENIAALQATESVVGTAGFSLFDASGNTLFDFHSMGGTNSWFLTDDLQSDVDEGAFVQYGYHVDRLYSFTLGPVDPITHLATYTFTVTGDSTTVTGGTAIFTGTINDAAGIGQIDFYNSHGGDASDVQFTNLNVSAVPEPATMGGMFAAALLLGYRRGGVR